MYVKIQPEEGRNRQGSRKITKVVDVEAAMAKFLVLISFLFKATKSFLFDETHKWLILGRKLDDILSLLNDDSFGVVTDITIAIETDTGFDLYDVYNPCKARGGSLNVTILGYWTEKSGVAIRLKQSKYERRFNLHGMKLRVGVLVSNWLVYNEYSNW